MLNPRQSPKHPPRLEMKSTSVIRCDFWYSEWNNIVHVSFYYKIEISYHPAQSKPQNRGSALRCLSRGRYRWAHLPGTKTFVTSGIHGDISSITDEESSRPLSYNQHRKQKMIQASFSREGNLRSGSQKLLFFSQRADVPLPCWIQSLRSVPGNCKVFASTWCRKAGCHCSPGEGGGPNPGGDPNWEVQGGLLAGTLGCSSCTEGSCSGWRYHTAYIQVCEG